MKILVVTPYFYPAYTYGGPIDAAYQTSKEWVDQGHTVTVVTTNANGRTKLDVETRSGVALAGMTVYYCWSILSSAVSLRMLWRIWQQMRLADFVVLHFVYSFPTIPTLLFARLQHKKILWRPHGALSRWSGANKQLLKKNWIKLCRLIASSETVILFTSILEKEKSKSHFPKLVSVVIPNGVIAPSGLLRRTNSGKIRIIFLGRINPIKGLENLLLAISRIDSVKYGLKIFGKGEYLYEKKIQKMIHELKLESRVALCGEIAHENLADIFTDADLLILPSHSENFGQVVVEALAHAVPVIASKNTPWGQLGEVGCGLWVENDPASLAKAIERISRQNLVEMGLKGRAWVREEFAWPKTARMMIDTAILRKSI